MDARMNQRVVDHEIPALRKSREDGEIRDITAAKIERRVGAEIGCSFAFECFMLGVIATQQTRSARSDRHATRHCLGSRPPQFLGFGQAEIIVRREIYSGALAK